MTEQAGIWHGGDLDEARRLFRQAPEPWIDLSTGINPVAYPLPDFTPQLFERLPAPGAQADLERAAASAYGAPQPAQVVAAPGTQVLISLLPHLRPRSRVAVVGPTYAEHARAWSLAGHEVAPVAGLDEAAGADVAVLVNPNNPDGRVVPPAALRRAAGELAGRGGWLVVDEAFADFEVGPSLVPDLPEAAIVLRSFGKTYGLAGVRLGFAAAREPLAGRLRAALGPWAVSGPAIEVGRRALRDRAWLDRAGRDRAADARRLSDLLRWATGTDPTGTTLFRLVETPLAPALFDALGRRGIWTRRFQDRPHRLRLGLPGSEAAWERLEGALAAFGR